MRNKKKRPRSAQALENIHMRTGSAKMAVDVDIQDIADYFCDAGPGLCRRCPSRCAYGERYVNEVLNTGMGKIR